MQEENHSQPTERRSSQNNESTAHDRNPNESEEILDLLHPMGAGPTTTEKVKTEAARFARDFFSF